MWYTSTFREVLALIECQHFPREASLVWCLIYRPVDANQIVCLSVCLASLLNTSMPCSCLRDFILN